MKFSQQNTPLLHRANSIKNHLIMQWGGGGQKQYCLGTSTITLIQCPKCSYIFNSTFDLEAIAKEYQSQGYYSRKIVSKVMNENIQSIKNTILRYINQDSVCLEIAPGSGDMVLALIDFVKYFYTVDPSLVSLEFEKANNLQHIQAFFNYKTIKETLQHKVNFILFRHLLEHINTPLNFLKDVVDLVENNGIIYIEVPNIEEFIKHKRFYEIFNDHCGYYQKNTLINTLENLGCTFLDEIFLYRGQHMGLFFQKKENPNIKKQCDFIIYPNLNNLFNENIILLNQLIQPYKNIAIYGAGAHGNTIATFLSQENLQNIKKCFDLDKRKQGQYLQNSAIQIVEPNKQNFTDIDCIIIAAPLYEEEVQHSLRERGFKGNIILTEKEIKSQKNNQYKVSTNS